MVAPKRFRIELSIFLVLLGIFLGWRIPEVAGRKLSAYAFFDPVVDLRDKIDRFYVSEPDEQEMLTGTLRGMIATLDDPYTNYFTPKQLAGFERSTTGTFTGIGAEIEVRDDQLRIVTPLEDSPAFKAGILAGDAILEINGEATDGLTVEEAVEKITGPENTEVVLKVRHPNGAEEDITITRQKIEIETVRGFTRQADGHWNYLLDAQKKIGYIRIAQFSAPTYEALTEAVGELQKQEMKGLIIDLRYNPGGLLNAAVKISNLFLDEGVIVSTKGRGGDNERVIRADSSDTLSPFPMVVLVNEGSASASEIVSGALKDNDRAIVLGTRTVGKGSVQELMKLDGDAGAVKLTTNYYYLPSGRNINRRDDAEEWGVDPNDGFYVPMTTQQREDMVKVRREGDIIRQAADQDNGPKRITPEWIRDELKDIQLAAAVEAMIAKLDTGQFKATGKSNATLLAYLSERELLTRRREAYEERIATIDERLAKLAEHINGNGEEDDQTTAADGKATDEADKAVEPALEEAAP
jgi:carboxyl-terminal processing protease